MKTCIRLLLFTFLLPCALSARDFYLDSANGDDADRGTSPEAAWKTLEKVNETPFKPGDTLHLKRGGIWFGQLKPRGSGAPGNPIVVRDYGSGNLPLIDGNGVVGEAVVYLHNQEYIEIHNLEIVNDAEAEGDRRGVWVSGSNIGVLSSIYLQGLYIHDIYGIAGQSLEAKRTGGIYIAMTDDAEKPSRWHDIRIENCIIHDVRNSGLTIQNETTQHIEDFPPDSEKWTPRRVTGLYVANNTIYNVAKNGMIIRLADGGLVEHNLLFETAIGGDGKGMSGNTIFSRSAKDTVFQFNEGYNNRSPSYDGCLYDADLNSPGTIWQYSYSHDNAHGLYWGCTVQADTGVIVRYNISQNDKGGIFVVNYPVSGTQIYNNTVYIGPHRSPIILYERGRREGTRDYEFHNNLIISRSKDAGYEFNLREDRGYTRDIRNNLFFGVEPPEYGENHIVGDPRLIGAGQGGSQIDFKDPNRLSGYRIRADSAARDAGIMIEDNGGRDFWGNPLEDELPDIGVHEWTPARP
jgi:hypothetical protein